MVFHLMGDVSFWVQSVWDVLPQFFSFGTNSSHGTSAIDRGQLPRYDCCSHGIRVIDVNVNVINVINVASHTPPDDGLLSCCMYG